MIAAWFLFLGGAVGSFLNVVVYRLPAGMSISWPGSHCPRCNHAIRAYDNIPVLAWFWLRGRCRDCRQPISFRYPLVEAVTAGLFLLLLVVEVFHGGQNLPVRIPPCRKGLTRIRPRKPWASACFHLGLLCTLMAAGLIRWDGKRPPRRLFVPLLLVGLIAPSIWPWLHPLPAGPGVAESSLGRRGRWPAGPRNRVLPGPARPVVGQAFRRHGQARKSNHGRGPGRRCRALWQAVLLLVPLALLWEELSRIAALRWSPPPPLVAAVWIAPLALFWILNWARLAIWLGVG